MEKKVLSMYFSGLIWKRVVKKGDILHPTKAIILLTMSIGCLFLFFFIVFHSVFFVFPFRISHVISFSFNFVLSICFLLVHPVHLLYIQLLPYEHEIRIRYVFIIQSIASQIKKWMSQD